MTHKKNKITATRDLPIVDLSGMPFKYGEGEPSCYGVYLKLRKRYRDLPLKFRFLVVFESPQDS